MPMALRDLLRTTGLAILGLSLLATACGDEVAIVAEERSGDQDADVGGWSQQSLGPKPVDSSLAAVASGDMTVIAGTGPDGFAAWFDDGDRFVAATIDRGDDGPAGDAREGASVDGLAAVPGGFLAAMNDYRTFRPQLWFSGDGRTWRPLETTGLDGPADVTSIAAGGDVVVIGGAGRGSPDPGSGPFTPVVWHSEDLENWTAAVVEPVTDGAVTNIVAAGDGLAAFGPSRIGQTEWRSADGGRSWSTVPTPNIGSASGGFEFNDFAVDDGVIVGVGRLDAESGEGLLLARSIDGGNTWERADLSPIGPAGLQGGYSIARAGDAWWATTARFNQAWSNPDLCYGDIDRCNGEQQPLLLRSEDGLRWESVDLGPLELPRYANLDLVLPREDRLSVVGGGESIGLWTWSDPGPPPLLAAPGDDSGTPSEHPLVGWEATLTLDSTYRYPLYIHCGMDYLANFNGAHWYLESGLGDGRPQPHWPVAQETIFGFVTLIDDETIEYSIGDGEVIGTYKRSEAEPPGCD